MSPGDGEDVTIQIMQNSVREMLAGYPGCHFAYSRGWNALTLAVQEAVFSKGLGFMRDDAREIEEWCAETSVECGRMADASAILWVRPANDEEDVLIRLRWH